jgi:anti-sigma B factor antagonist
VSTPSDLSSGLHVKSLDGNGAFLVEGELDMATVPRLRKLLKEHLPARGDVILDVSGLSFIDSTGLQEILDLSARLTEGAIVLRNPTPSVRKIIHVTGLDRTERLKIEPEGSVS